MAAFAQRTLQDRALAVETADSSYEGLRGQGRRTRSVRASRAAPLGGIWQHEQVQTSEKLQGERDHRQESHRVCVLLLRYGDDVDDHGRCKGHGQPAVGLPNPFVPVHLNLLMTLSRIRRPVLRSFRSPDS
jgi:hypothetical protein